MADLAKLVAEAKTLEINELLNRALNHANRAIYTDELNARGGEPGIRRYYQGPQATNGSGGNGDKPVPLDFKNAVDAEYLTDTAQHLVKHLDQYWKDETYKQRWEVKDFLDQCYRRNYLDLSIKEQNFFKRILNGYNRWVHGTN